MLKFRLGLCAALLLTLLPGCSPRNPNAPGRISGQVKYKGNPLTAGNITFHSDDKGVYNCALGSDGTYEIVDIAIGTMVVTVETETFNPKKKTPQYGEGLGAKQYTERLAAEKKMGAPIAQKGDGLNYVAIPEKYSNRKTSPLSATIESGRQVKDFEFGD